MTHEGYDIIPGPEDGVATASPDWPYPRGDVWILRYRGTELVEHLTKTSVVLGRAAQAVVNETDRAIDVRNAGQLRQFVITVIDG